MHSSCVQRINVLLCYELQLFSKKSKYYYITYYKCIQGIIVLQNNFKERKCYCDMTYIQVKKISHIYLILILFEKLHYEQVERFHVQGTKLCKLLLGQSQYTLLSTGQSNNH